MVPIGKPVAPKRPIKDFFCYVFKGQGLEVPTGEEIEEINASNMQRMQESSSEDSSFHGQATTTGRSAPFRQGTGIPKTMVSTHEVETTDSHAEEVDFSGLTNIER